MEKAKTIERALQVLCCFSREERELTASELARRLGLSRTAVVRILSTLEAAGFVQRGSANSGYHIGLTAFRIGSLYLTANPLVGFATSCLDTLAKKTGCTAYLTGMDGDDAIILAHHEGSHAIRFVWKTGDHLPICTSAAGKAMLARLPVNMLDRILGKKDLRGMTEHSLRSRAELDVQLQRIRKRGWAIARDESSLGITAIGAAIVDQTGHPIAGISISYVPATVRDLTIKPEVLGQIVSEHAALISARAREYSAYGHDLRPARST